MVDIHCHILPNVDDGPPSISQFINMANCATLSGITEIFATPHHLNGKYGNSREKILENVNRCNNLLKNEGISLTLHPGQELRIHSDIFKTIELGEVLTLSDKGKYILLELPSSYIPDYTYNILYELLLREIIPIIPHPERNMRFLDEPNLLYMMVQEGVLTQLTAGSIIGHFGKKIKLFSEKLIEHQLAHFISTDAHDVQTRGFCLQEAYEVISRIYGIDQTYYFMENAELLKKDQSVNNDRPSPIKKKIFGLF